MHFVSLPFSRNIGRINARRGRGTKECSLFSVPRLPMAACGCHPPREKCVPFAISLRKIAGKSYRQFRPFSSLAPSLPQERRTYPSRRRAPRRKSSDETPFSLCRRCNPRRAYELTELTLGNLMFPYSFNISASLGRILEELFSQEESAQCGECNFTNYILRMSDFWSGP